MLLSISMSKPQKLSLSILKSIFGANLYRSQDAEKISKYPVIPKGRQFNDLKGNVNEVALNPSITKHNEVYIGFKLTQNLVGSWTYSPQLFNVKQGKVIDYCLSSAKWKTFKDVKYVGIKLPEKYWNNRGYANLWFDQAFIKEQSPLALIEVIPKEKKNET